MKTFVKSILVFAAVFVLGAGMASCKKDDNEPRCKTCSAEQVIYVDGKEFGSQSVSGTQFCDEALDEIEANPSITIMQEANGITQEVVTTYTCN